MNNENNLLNRKFFFSLILLFCLILFAFFVVDGYTHFNKISRIHRANSLDMIDQRITSLIYEMNIFPGGAGGDILFLSKLSGLKKIEDIGNIESEDEINELTTDFLEFIKENPAYYQLRYINEKGMEVIRVVFDTKNHTIVPKSDLQDKSSRFYFNETMRLNNGEVYISPLDLNVEQGKIENRGTQENPEYVPVIRFATPVFDNEGNNKGIIIANIYADYFLNDVRRAQREGETIFLINEESYYLAHPNKNKEYAFMFEDKEDNFHKDYPEVLDEILSNKNNKRIETENLIFSYRYLYPTVESFEINEGSKKILGENPENNYFWILVSVSEKGIIDNYVENLKRGYFYSILFSGLIILMIFILMIFIWRENGK